MRGLLLKTDEQNTRVDQQKTKWVCGAFEILLPDIWGATPPKRNLFIKNCVFILFLRFYLFLERDSKGGRKRERNTDVRETHHLVASCMPPTGDPAGNPGMCPDWESNQQPFGSQASTQSTEPHQPGCKNCVFILMCLNFSHLQSTIHLIQYSYRDIFFHCLNQFLNSSILMPFCTSAGFLVCLFFCLTFEDLRTFSAQKKKKKSDRVSPRERGAGGAGGAFHFWSKTAKHSAQCGQAHS